MTEREEYEVIVRFLEQRDKNCKERNHICSDCPMRGACVPNNVFTFTDYQKTMGTYVDWSKVPVDTRIYVKDNDLDIWVSRHFAKYEGDQVFAWDSGRSSWTASSCTPYSYVKLP